MSKQELIGNLELLDKLVMFKMKFYSKGWANYDLAKPGTLRLIPDKYRLKEFEKDYKAMQDMLFGERPEFVEIMETFEGLEDSINSLNK